MESPKLNLNLGQNDKTILKLNFKRKYRKKNKEEEEGEGETKRMESKTEIRGNRDVVSGYKWRCEQCHCQYMKRPKFCQWVEWEYDWEIIFLEFNGEMPWESNRNDDGTDFSWMYKPNWCGHQKFQRGVGWGK